ncbi:hypothetical protein [Mycolicibacterium moriokaense]|uniref:Uncharacterized protein n=1 Tax=Mycolicibacterium moriokaense TaxID=39691 RepID=A0AAD1H7J5_9MYCO|nr:hypothetical protein [Mycolicibacterium moriokaense]MCV7040105.1 hypothetical protein [Mycolicibacterium moriokaense]BBX00115.1 hypothetical protein MMOR_10510 [Mycolicibacterium moriokaense]
MAAAFAHDRGDTHASFNCWITFRSIVTVVDFLPRTYELCDQCAAELANGQQGQEFIVTHAGEQVARLQLTSPRQSRSVPPARHPVSPQTKSSSRERFDGIAKLRERRNSI